MHDDIHTVATHLREAPAESAESRVARYIRSLDEYANQTSRALSPRAKVASVEIALARALQHTWQTALEKSSSVPPHVTAPGTRPPSLPGRGTSPSGYGTSARPSLPARYARVQTHVPAPPPLPLLPPTRTPGT